MELNESSSEISALCLSRSVHTFSTHRRDPNAQHLHKALRQLVLGELVPLSNNSLGKYACCFVGRHSL